MTILTDMYSVRVLKVDPGRLRVRFQVFAVYYDTGSRTHIALPSEEPGIFLHFLWESAKGYLDNTDERKGPLGRELSTDDIGNLEWVDTNARRFISDVRCVETLNDPPTEEQWEEIHERASSWRRDKELLDLLVQGTYEIQVTDRTWLEHLSEGQTWESAAFPLNGDSWTAEDAPHIPDMAQPVVSLRPFETTTGSIEDDYVYRMAFSDDGRYLAAYSIQGRVWVYDTAHWSETVHTHAGDWDQPLMMWVPGRHILVVKNGCEWRASREKESQWAYDVDQGVEVEVPFQRGHLRSADGVYRISPNSAGDGRFDLHRKGSEPCRPLPHPGDREPIRCYDFSGDSSRLFLGYQDHLYVVDPAKGEVVDEIVDTDVPFALASNPDGRYLAIGGRSRKRHYLEDPAHELCIWRMTDKKIILGHQFRTDIEELAWSPNDGRWLAVALDHLDDSQSNNGMTEIAVFRTGPSENH